MMRQDDKKEKERKRATRVTYRRKNKTGNEEGYDLEVE